MKFEIEGVAPRGADVRLGYVYAARGGRAGKAGHLFVVVAITAKKPDKYGYDSDAGMACCLVVDRDGDVRGTTSYGVHIFEGREPCGYVPGIEELALVIKTGAP
jgi:hypothetical protein